MFRPSTRARYALRLMIELSLHDGEQWLLLKDIGDAQDISPKYLEQLVMPLRRAGLVLAERGPRGGYKLAKPPEEITAHDIVQAVEGSLCLVRCVQAPEVCKHTGRCAAHDFWTGLSNLIVQELAAVTLADLRDQQLEYARPTGMPGASWLGALCL